MSSRTIRGPLLFNNYTTVLTGVCTVVNEALVYLNKTIGAASSVVLPAANTASGSARRVVMVVDQKGDAATNNITVTVAGSGTINGAASYVMSQNYGVAAFVDNGTQWDLLFASVSVGTPGTGAAGKALVLDASGFLSMPAAGMFRPSTGTKAAAGTTSANATPVTEQITYVTASDGVKGVALPAAATTLGPITIINTVATASLLVYPVDSGNDNINGLAEDLALEIGPGEEVTFVPVSATQWFCQVPHNRFNFEIVTTTNVITAFENGKTFYLNNATGFVSTLPAPAAGLNFTFINMTANTSGNHTVVTNGSANIIKGNQNSVAGDAGDTGTSDDTISFVANNSLAGDKVEVYSDGTSWHAFAISRVAAGITFTTAS